MANYQQVYIPCKTNKNASNILYIFDILSKKRYEKLGNEISNKFNFYAVSAFFDDEYKLVLRKPDVKKWGKYIYEYIKSNKIDLSKTIIVSQYYACSLVPLLNDMLGGKIKKTIYVSPFIKFSRKTRKLLIDILYRNEASVVTLYNNINQLRNDVDWIQTSRLENVVVDANIKDLKKIIGYFHKPWHKWAIKKHQRRLKYFLGLFLGDKDEIVNFEQCSKFFSKYNKLKIYPFFNSKLCCFEEENFKFIDCLVDFNELG